MRRLLYVFAALSVTALSCSKEDEIMDKVDVPDRGQIRYINVSKNPYDIYLDGTKMGSMYGGDSVVIRNVMTGPRRVKVVQTDNIINKADAVKDQSIDVLKDSVVNFYYP
jgi:hypothetical protein